VLSSKSLVDRAREFALAAHNGQKRKYDGAPYSGHLDAVASILERNGVSRPEVVAAAYLRGTVRGTATTHRDIIEGFGREVGQLVYWLTDDIESDPETQALVAAWRLARAPWHAKLIKLADIIENSASIRRLGPAYAKTFLDESRQILRLMAEAEGAKLMQNKLFQQAVALTDTAQS
jgi:(p)ppGpp synthase/HD superfamily hydrolase